MNSLTQYHLLREVDMPLKERAKTLGQLAGISNKEIRESWSAFQKFRQIVPWDSHVLEVGAGHGMVGTLFAWSGHARATLMDLRYYLTVPRVAALAIKVKPHLAKYLDAHSDALSLRDPLPGEYSTIVSVHGCGDLTDLVLRLAVRHRKAVAVMPCCHGKRTTGVERCGDPLQLWPWTGLSKGYAIDAARAGWLAGQGYTVRCMSIDPSITPMNRIISGVPKERRS